MKIDTINYNDCSFSNLLVDSLKSSGFAVINNHPISSKLIDNVYDDWKKFFNPEKKHSYLFDYEKQDGYFPYKSENAKNYREKDLKEFYHIYPSFGRYPDFIGKDALLLYHELMCLSKKILLSIDLATPKNIKRKFSIPLHKMIDGSDQNLLRIIHYPPISQKKQQNALRAAPHADINLITLLVSGSKPGLQLKDKNNNWIDVKSNKGEIVVNIGDMLEVCSNKFYPSTIHRVINPNNKSNNVSRFSMPFFIHPRTDVILKKDLKAGTFLNNRLNEIGLK